MSWLCFLLLAAAAVHARPQWPSGLSESPQIPWPTEPLQEQRKGLLHPLKNIQAAARETVQDVRELFHQALDPMTKNTFGYRHRPVRQNLDPLSFVSGFVNQAIGGGKPRPSSHFNHGPQWQAPDQHHLGTPLGRPLQFGLPPLFNQRPQFGQPQHNHGGTHFGSSDHLNPRPHFDHTGHFNQGSSFESLDLFNPGPHFDQTSHVNQGSGFESAGSPDFASSLASSIQKIVQNNVAQLAPLDQLNLRPCPTCGHPVNPDPDVTHHAQVGRPQITIVSETRVEVICSGDNRNCPTVPKVPHHSATESSTSGSKVVTEPSVTPYPVQPSGSTGQQDGKSEGTQESDILFTDGPPQDRPRSDSDIDIRFGGEDSKDTTTKSLNIKV